MFLFDSKGKMVEIDFEDVICIQRLNRTTAYCTGPNNYFVPSTLKQLLEVYEPLGFKQIDKNKLINFDKADRIEGGIIYIGGSEYPVSRRKNPTGR